MKVTRLLALSGLLLMLLLFPRAALADCASEDPSCTFLPPQSLEKLAYPVSTS
jgi:hypothetical protein